MPRFPHPPARRGLGNVYGARCSTTDPVPAERPDLRRYPVPRRTPVPEDKPPAERREFRRQLIATKPDVTRWRLSDGRGVCDQRGNRTTATILCQRDGCSRWFSVERYPVNRRGAYDPGARAVHGRWPWFCSDTCQEISDATRARRNARRFRAGGTEGLRRPRFGSFDPEGMPVWQAIELAERIVDARNGDTSTSAAYAAAARYVDDYAAESKRYQEQQDAEDIALWDASDLD